MAPVKCYLFNTLIIKFYPIENNLFFSRHGPKIVTVQLTRGLYFFYYTFTKKRTTYNYCVLNLKNTSVLFLAGKTFSILRSSVETYLDKSSK